MHSSAAERARELRKFEHWQRTSEANNEWNIEEWLIHRETNNFALVRSHFRESQFGASVNCSWRRKISKGLVSGARIPVHARKLLCGHLSEEFEKDLSKEKSTIQFSLRPSLRSSRSLLLSIFPVYLFGSCVSIRIRIEADATQRRSRRIVSDIVTVLLVTAIAIEIEALAISESNAEIGAEKNVSSTEPARSTVRYRRSQFAPLMLAPRA